MLIMKRLVCFSLAIACAQASLLAQAEDIAVSGDIGVVSQYITRGATITSGKAAVQGDLVVGYGGLSASTWFSNAHPSPAPQYAGRDTVEFDWTLDYSAALDAVGYSVGFAYYTYLYDSASNYSEAYIGLSYDAPISPSFTALVAVADSQNKVDLAGDVWVDFSLSTDIAGLTFAAGGSFAYWAKDAVNRPNIDIYRDGLTVATLGVSKDIIVDDVVFTASLVGSMPVIKDSPDGKKYIYGSEVNPEVAFGLNMAF